VGPGSFIFVGWDNHYLNIIGTDQIGNRRLRLTGKVVNFPETDLPPVALGTASAPGMSELKQGGVDITAVLGKFAPEVQIGVGSRIVYPQTDFSFKGYDANHASASLSASPSTVADISGDLYSTLDNKGNRAFLHFGKGYLVTAVYSVEKLHVVNTNSAQVKASLQALKAGDCLPPAPISQFDETDPNATGGTGTVAPGKSSTTTGAPASSDTVKKATGATTPPANTPPSAPQTVLQKAGSALTADLNIQVSICKTSNTEFDLKASPSVPLGIKVIAVNFDGLNPKLDVTGPIDYFRTAMKHAD
jgi:hypothetical protein